MFEFLALLGATLREVTWPADWDFTLHKAWFFEAEDDGWVTVEGPQFHEIMSWIPGKDK